MNGTDNQSSNAATANPAGQPVQGAPGYSVTYAPPPPQRQPQDPRAKSPALACFLSIMPGLGQVYVGYYQRGFIHALVVASLIALLAADVGALIPLAAIFMAFFWLYNIIDAGRRAAFYNQALAGQEEIDLPSDFKLPGFGGSIFGGSVLIVAGFLLLLHTRFDMSLDWIEEWWPVAPIALGVYLLVKAIQERSGASSSPE